MNPQNDVKNVPLEVVIEAIKVRLRRLEEEPLRIALYGQPGAGKSSLINAFAGKEIAKVGQRTDTTQEAQVIKWKNNIWFVDLPGYDTSKFPADSFTDHFDPKDYDAFLCVFEQKLHKADVEMFRKLRDSGKVTIFVRNKSDNLWQEGKTVEELKNEIKEDVYETVGTEVPLVFTSCKTKEGISELETIIEKNLQDIKMQKWILNIKAYSDDILEKKKESCKEIVKYYAFLSTANVVNPVPGLDISVDITIMLNMVKKIRECYDISESTIEMYSPFLTKLYGSAYLKRLLSYSTKAGVEALLETIIKRFGREEFLKHVPIIGTIVAGGLAFYATYKTGLSILEDFHKAAEAILRAAADQSLKSAETSSTMEA